MDWARFLAVLGGGAFLAVSPVARAESAPSEAGEPEPQSGAATGDPGSVPVDAEPVSSTSRAKVTPLGQLVEPEARTRPPLVVIGPLLATVFRPSRSDAIRYEPGIAYGAFVMVPITEWLLTRASFRQELIPVSAPAGALGIEGPSRSLALSQPNLSALAFSAEAEGVYRPLSRLFLRAGVGVAWARVVAPPPEAENFYVDAERSLTVSTISLSLGAAYTLIPSWLELGLRVSGGLPFAQTGRMILPLQVVVDGELAHVDPLPEMAGLLDATLELGVVF